MVCQRIEFCDNQSSFFDHLEPTDWNSAIQELLEKQGVDIKSEMERK